MKQDERNDVKFCSVETEPSFSKGKAVESVGIETERVLYVIRFFAYY